MSSAGELIRETRASCGLSQERLARRARTTTRHVRRIEHGEVSPTVEMVERLLAAMGRQLNLGAEIGPLDNRSDLECLHDARLPASERLAQAAALSRTLTGVAESARQQKR
ncbi:MAG TPA: helix-turn-helix transcriptional regulator [Solirubrobacteraceae bacterium]|nr:helix-turn-helix transcriptional regulator [Solirubrobacteraceae bacterium]